MTMSLRTPLSPTTRSTHCPSTVVSQSTKSSPMMSGEGGSHVDTDRLQQDHNKGEKCPVGVLAHREICPPRLNRNEEHNYRPYQSRGVQLHFGPGQDETTKPEQDLRDCQA